MDIKIFHFPCCPQPYSLLLFFFLFYLITNSGHLGTYDAAMEYEVTKNFIQHGSFELKDEQFDEGSAALGTNGKLYSPHGLGQSLAMIPFYFIGEGTSKLFPRFPGVWIHHFCVSLMNPMLMALTCVVLYLFQRRMGFHQRIAMVATCICGIVTIAFPYTKVSFDVTLTAFCLLSAAYLIYRFRTTLGSEWAFFSGVFVGLSLLTRLASFLVIPPFFFYFILCIKKENLNAFRIAQLMISFSIPIAISMIILGCYNAHRFGVFYEDGHALDAAVKLTTPFLVGFAGQLISPGKGLFLYSPILIFSVLGVQKLYRIHSWETLLFMSIICGNLFFYSKLANWSGDWCWGPRFTVPIVPFLTLFIGTFLNETDMGKRIGLRYIWITLLILSLCVQILGVTIDGTRRIGRRYNSNTVTKTQVYWHPATSPLIDHAQLLRRISFSPIQSSRSESKGIEEISYKDTTADFWFVYLFSVGFPLKWILISMSVLIILDIYFGYLILHTILRKRERKR